MSGGPRVLMVVRLFYPWVGGMERQAHALARALLELGVDVRIVTGRWYRGTPRHEVFGGVPIDRNHTLWECFGIRGLRTLGGYLYMLTLGWYLWRRRHTYDVVHVHGLNYHTFVAATVARRLGKPVLVKLANSGEASDIRKMREDRQLRFARRMLPGALRCDRFVALNDSIAGELRATGVDPRSIVRLANGVPITSLPRTNHEIHAPPVIVYVGRLHEQKGLDTLLAALASLQSTRGRAARLHLVGDGPASDRLRRLAETGGIADRVTFAGVVPDVQPWLAAADVFVLPSRVEGMSNALLEAMVAGVPVVVTGIPGNRALVEHERTGLVVPVAAPAELAAAIERLLDDGDLRARMAVAARRLVECDYSVQAIARRYVEVYRGLAPVGLPDQPAAPVPVRQ